MLESANFLRAERRRRLHLEKWAAAQAGGVPGSEEDRLRLEEWRGHLDEALDSLGRSDRELVLGRFFEERSFPELAARRGSSPDAVRVRLSRILEKLCAVLRRRGASLPVAALTGLFAGQWAHAAPAAVGAAAAAAAPVQALPPAQTCLTLMTSAKSLTLTGLVLIASSMALWPQHDRIQALQARWEGVSNSSAFTVAASMPDAGHRDRPSKSRGTPEGAEDESGPPTALTLLRDVRSLSSSMRNNQAVRFAVERRTAKLSPAELKALIAAVDAAEGGAGLKSLVRSCLVGEILAARDPAAALQEAIHRRMSDSVFENIARIWTSSARDGAAAPLRVYLENPDSLPPAGFGADPAGALRRGLAMGLAETDPGAAERLCRAAAGSAAAADYLAGAAEALAKGGAVDSILELFAGVPEGPLRAPLLGRITREAARYLSGERDVSDFVNHPRYPQPLRKEAVLRAALAINSEGIDDNNYAAIHLLQTAGPAAETPEVLAEWMRRATPPEDTPEVFDPEDATAADGLMEQALRQAAPADPAAARRWLVLVHDPALRGRLAGEIKPVSP